MITLTPAYGRDYKNKKEVLAAFEAGNDFILNDITSRWDGKPCKKSDLPTGQVRIRYDKQRRVLVTQV